MSYKQYLKDLGVLSCCCQHMTQPPHSLTLGHWEIPWLNGHVYSVDKQQMPAWLPNKGSGFLCHQYQVNVGQKFTNMVTPSTPGEKMFFLCPFARENNVPFIHGISLTLAICHKEHGAMFYCCCCPLLFWESVLLLCIFLKNAELFFFFEYEQWMFS